LELNYLQIDGIKKKILIAAIISITLLFGIWFWMQRPIDEYSIAEETGISPGLSTSQTNGEFYVHLDGAVINPGVYQVAPNTRLFQLIDLAGGESVDADLASINLAQVIVDGNKYHIPFTYATDIFAAESSAKDSLVNINLADAAILDTLPGVGPATAEKIMHFREQNGAFTCGEDIMNVPGIGPTKYEQLKTLIKVK
jgi:competence protein ComEA